MSDPIRTTPYCDSHAEAVKIVADTYDPEALVVPKRKAMNLEIETHHLRVENARLRRELNSAKMCLKEIVSQIAHIDGDVWQLACCSTDEVDRWRLASVGKNQNCKQCDAPSGIPSTDLLASRAIARLAIATAMTKAVAIYAADGKDAARDFIKDRCRALVDELIPKDANSKHSGSSADANG